MSEQSFVVNTCQHLSPRCCSVVCLTPLHSIFVQGLVHPPITAEFWLFNLARLVGRTENKAGILNTWLPPSLSAVYSGVGGSPRLPNIIDQQCRDGSFLGRKSFKMQKYRHFVKQVEVNYTIIGFPSPDFLYSEMTGSPPSVLRQFRAGEHLYRNFVT